MSKPDRKANNLVLLDGAGWAPTNKDVADALREWATAIEHDEATYNSAIIVVEVNGEIHRAVLGGPNDRARVMGILFAAATIAVGDCAGWGDHGAMRLG